MRMSDFDLLKPYLEKMKRLNHLLSIVNFDMETKAPVAALEEEGDLLSYYSTERAAIYQDPDFIAAVKKANAQEDLNDAQKLLLGDFMDSIEYMEKIDLETVKRFDKEQSKCAELWREAKSKSDFSIVKEALEKVVANKIEEAKLLKKDYHKTLYDVLLDDYEKGSSQEAIDAVFEPLKSFLITHLPRILEKQKAYAMPSILPHPKHEQEELSLALLEVINYDMNRGAIAETEHPFSDAVAKMDSRVTTHYHEDDWRSSMFSVLHEGGHALQFQNWSDYEHENFVNGRASAAQCETHSRFYENTLGRNKHFAKTLLNLCKKSLKSEMNDYSEEDFYRVINQVQPSLIRTEADEFTYCLHIIIRYELERDLINGKLAVADLPGAWKEKYREYLGIEVPNDKEGVLQDIHWYEGLFGYFPSYALGNIYGAQIFYHMKKELDVDSLLEEGNLAPILDYLRTKDFAYDYLDPNEWILKVTNEPMRSAYFVDYLKEKYF